MSRKQASRQFAADNRAVSAVIGFILVFGILMLLLTVYQAQIVPQQNAQTEFEHFEDTQNELIELRNSISTAGQADVSQFPSVTLGTNYQTRLLTINPTTPVGTLQTSEPYNITIENETQQTNVSSRFLVYEPGYNEMRIGSTTYEHSVLYLDERDRENNVSIIEEQNLVKDGTVQITALQNSFQQQGTSRITLELYPQGELSDGDGDLPEGDELNVTIPTQLDADEYWDDALTDEDMYDGVDVNAHEEGVHALNLSVEPDDLEINTVGIQLEPDEEPAKNTEPMGGSSEQEEEEEEEGEGGEGGEGGEEGEEESSEDASVFVSTSDNFNNDQIETGFEVTDGSETFEFTVHIEESGREFQNQEVNIDGDSFELTDAAREDILNDVETDILDADNFDAEQSGLDTYRDEIDTNFEIENVDHDGSRDLTTIEVQSIE